MIPSQRIMYWRFTLYLNHSGIYCRHSSRYPAKAPISRGCTSTIDQHQIADGIFLFAGHFFGKAPGITLIYFGDLKTTIFLRAIAWLHKPKT